MKNKKPVNGIAHIWILNQGEQEAESTQDIKSSSDLTPAFHGHIILDLPQTTNKHPLSNTVHCSQVIEVEDLPDQGLSYVNQHQKATIKIIGFSSETSTEICDQFSKTTSICPLHNPIQPLLSTRCQIQASKADFTEPDCCSGGPEERPRYYNVFFVIPKKLNLNFRGDLSNSHENDGPPVCLCSEPPSFCNFLSPWLNPETEAITLFRDVEKTVGSGDAWRLVHHHCQHHFELPLRRKRTANTVTVPENSNSVPIFEFTTTVLKSGYTANEHLVDYFGIDLKKTFENSESEISETEIASWMNELLVCLGTVNFFT